MAQLLKIMLLIVLFMFAFGISYQALQYHNVPLNWMLFKNVFLTAFFVIAGEYYTRDTMINSIFKKSFKKPSHRCIRIKF
jgi:hypothetical protein